MREPVVEFIRGHLLLLAAIRMHAPDLHPAAPVRIEINPLAIRRIIRTVIQSIRARQASLSPAVQWNGVDIEVAISLGTISERQAVRRPAVPIRWPQLRHAPWSAAANG